MTIWDTPAQLINTNSILSREAACETIVSVAPFFICLVIPLFIHPLSYPFIFCLFFNSFIHLSIHLLFLYSSISLTVHPFFCSSICLSICLFSWPLNNFVQSSVYSFWYSFIFCQFSCLFFCSSASSQRVSKTMDSTELQFFSQKDSSEKLSLQCYECVANINAVKVNIINKSIKLFCRRCCRL